MSDLIERLRQSVGGPDITNIAADEIERLTAELFAANLKAKTYEEGYDEMVAARDYFQKDNERLRAALEFIAAADQIHLWDAIKAADEALAGVEGKT